MAEIDASMEDMDPLEDFDNDEEVDPSTHEKLLKSIYALDGKKRYQNEVRGAAAPSGNLDLVVYTKKDQAKIQPEDLEVNNKRKAAYTLSKPMGELETERAKRLIAQESMTSDVAKWDPVVHEIRAAPQIKYSDRPKGLEMYEAMKPKKFSPRTPLEMEIYEALGKSQDAIHPDQELTVAERNALKAMSVKEARERRKELMKHHELLFRMEIRAKRVKKIKSKTYRKFQRKDRITAEKKKLEEMQQNDPEAFMEKMEQLETARMEERLTLKHRGGGKFSRTHKAYSKFDTKTRDAVQEMLQKSRELTKKRQVESSSEEDEAENVLITDTQSITRPAVVEDEDDAVGDKSSRPSDLSSKQLDILKAVNKKAGGWLDGPTAFVYTDQNQTENTRLSHDENKGDSQERKDNDNKDENRRSASETVSVKRSKSVSHNVLDIDDGDEEEDHVLTSQRESKANRSEDQETKVSDNKGDSGKKGSVLSAQEGDKTDVQSPNMKRTNKRKHDSTEEDGEKDSEKGEEEVVQESKKLGKKKRKRRKGKKETNTANSESSQSKKAVQEITLKPSAREEMEKMEDEEDEEEDGMRVTMEELFQDEDVVEQFAKDKMELEEQKRPKKVDTTLPGWGHWSGPDYKNKPPVQKRRKKFTKPQKPKSAQSAMPNVWLNPNRNEALRKFQPKQVPFPYTSVDQYEASLRQPVSRGFVRETAYKALNKPEVVTKLGHIIKPLDKNDFFKKKELDDDEDFGKKSGSKDSKYTGHIKFWNNRKAVK